MNILLVASRKWVQTDDKLFKKILESIKKTGQKVHYEHNYIPFEDWTEADKKKFAKDFEKVRKSTDVLIAEVSGPSIGLGFEISRAALEKKPTLVLYTKDHRINVSGTVMGADENRNVVVSTYDESLIDSIISDFIEKAQRKLDTKFILIISPEIDRYLEWASEQKRMHKAQIVRNAVEKMMKENDEWNDLNNEQ